ENGYTGQKGSGSSTTYIEYSAASSISNTSKVRNSQNQVVAESVRNDNVVVATINQVTITFTLDPVDVSQSQVSTLLDSEEQSLQTFRQTAESVRIRSIIADLIAYRARGDEARLKGFVVIADLFGGLSLFAFRIIGESGVQYANICPGFCTTTQSLSS
ncbi:MAG: hypothetical protein LC730_02130, partial [Acidobacteria bacterium]|nr:hypothetical protein [Acidobacteriota bacterium]MCA1608239.1 hypothetical protein [Acidobacteriota bacterium]